MAEQTVKTLCRMCDDHCGMEVTVEDGVVKGVRGNPDHPWNRGHLCAKGKAAVEFVNAPDRLYRPLKKTPQGWEEIPLEQALDEIARRVRDIQARYGDRGMGIWKGEAVGFNQEEEMARRFCHAIGTPNYFSCDSQCFVSRFMGYRFVFGTSAYPFPDCANSRAILVWGTNPPSTHPFMTHSIQRGQQRGAKLVAVDPRLSHIARQADLFVRILPGTDGALALGLANILISRGWYDRDFIEHHTMGFDRFRDYAAGFDKASVAEETGISPEEMEEMARTLYEASPEVSIYMGVGLEHHVNGVNNIRAIAALPALCGALDRKGGNRLLAGPPLRNLTLYDEKPLTHLGPIGADRFPVLYDQRQECHTMTAMETILTGDPYPLRGMIVTAGNPASTNPNLRKVKEALAGLDLLVVRELFMTETARLADYVLPAASFMERTEVFCHASLQLLNLTQRVFSIPGVQDEYSFWRDLAHRLGAGEYFPWENEEELNAWILEPTPFTTEELAAHPEGVRYTPIRLEKWRHTPLNTESGKVEFTSDYLRRFGLSELPEYIQPAYRKQPDETYPLCMTTGARKSFFVHSRYHNIPRFNRLCPEAELEMHPRDAAALGLVDGQRVRVVSRHGEVAMQLCIVQEGEIKGGCVHSLHGFCRDNVNYVTHDLDNDPISGFPLLKSFPVRVEAAEEEPSW
ncbi:MAG: molybdopterin-dependent oxidoreductase [Synergistales bacterium]|nr:molybdopterin-dependent oxidoreductase [Synergistales bacterium]